MELKDRVPESLRNNVAIVKLDELFRWAHANSLWPLSSGLACCAIEMMSTARRASTSRASATRSSAHARARRIS